MLLIELTDTGRETANAFRQVVHQHQKVWLDSLSEKEQQRLLNILHQLQAVLMNAEPENATI